LLCHHPRWSNGTFYTEICVGGARLTLGTFTTVEQAAGAYDATAWRLERPRQQLNFKDCEPAEEAELLAGFDNLVTAEQHRNRHLQRHLTIAEADERPMKAWRAASPRDVLDKQAFYASKKVEKDAIHTRKRWIEAQYAGQHAIDDDDDRWADLVLTEPPDSPGSDFDFSDV
jgi:hypothetical protein